MKKIYITIFIVFISASSNAETMTGGGYTLNGSVDTTVGQGQGGSYTLNPNSDPLSTQNSTGGTYTLYPTPYSTPIVPVTPGSGTPVQEVIRAVVFGTQVPNYQEYYPGAIKGTTRPGVVQTKPTRPASGSGSTNQGGSASTTYDSSVTIINYEGSGTSTIDEFGELVTSDSNYEYPDNVNFGKGTSTLENGVKVVKEKMNWWWLVLILIVLFIVRSLRKK